MKIFCQLLFLFSLFGSVSAQEASAPAGQADAAKGRPKIVVMRSISFVAGANPANVWINDREIGSVRVGKFVSWETEPGKTKVRIKPGGIAVPRYSKVIEVDAVPGETVYVLADAATFTQFSLEVLNADKGRQLFEKYKENANKRYLPPNEIKIKE
jgi:hypothetical protein